MSPATERLKMHRRVLDLDGSRYTALSPRPGEGCALATAHTPEGPVILSDLAGVHLLGRLCWAMGYQRHDRTIVVVEGSSPGADRDPSTPVVISNSDLGNLAAGAIGVLAGTLPFAGPSEGTVVLQTRGLDVALGDPAAFRARDEQAGLRAVPRDRRWVHAADGTALLVVEAPAAVLRAWGVSLSRLGSPADREEGGVDPRRSPVWTVDEVRLASDHTV